MASPTPNKNYTYPAHGGAVNAWDTPLNTNFDFIDLNLGGYYSIVCGSSIAGATFNSTNATISSSITSATLPSSLAENMFYKVSGGLSGNLSLVFPAAGGFYGINNASSNAFSLTVTTASSIAVGYTVPQGGISFCMTDGITIFTDTNKANASIIPITYSEMQTVTASRLLGNPSSIAAIPSEVTIGTGLTLTSSNSTISNQALPVPAVFKNLSIKVATNTTVTVAADFVTVTDGTSYITVPVSATCNLGAAGAVNELDAGTIAAATWYSMWVIYNGTTVGTLASLSATGPTMPAGYTFKARVGWVRTAAAVAQLLGTWQYGRQAQYVVGLAQTTVIPNIANGPAGTPGPTTTVWATPSVSNFVPTTATAISVLLHNKYNGLAIADNVQVAPNNSYGGSQSTNPPWASLSVTNAVTVTIRMVLEATTIAWASNANGGAIYATGWEDNI